MSVFEGLGERVRQALAADQKKNGGMHVSGMARQGLAELRDAVSLEGSVAQPTVLGIYGTMTPGEVAAARQDEGNVYGPTSSEADPVAAARQQTAASASMQQQRTGKEVD